MTITLSDLEVSRWIAEKRGWTIESDDNCPPYFVLLDAERRIIARHYETAIWKFAPDMVNTAAMTLMLMEDMPEPNLWLESSIGKPKLWGCDAHINYPDEEARPVSFNAKLGRAVAEAWMLANGYREGEK